jgi:putative Mn2+ efflux pump MntP
MDYFWQILTHTPIWVYILLIFLIYRCILTLKPRIIPLKKIFILPAVFIFLSIHTLFTVELYAVTFIIIAIVLAILGFIGGWFHIRSQKIEIDREHQLIYQQGSWLTLVLVLLIIICKFYIGFALAMTHHIQLHQQLLIFIYAVSGATVGLMLGRTAHYLYVYQSKTSTNLTK